MMSSPPIYASIFLVDTPPPPPVSRIDIDLIVRTAGTKKHKKLRTKMRNTESFYYFFEFYYSCIQQQAVLFVLLVVLLIVWKNVRNRTSPRTRICCVFL